MADQKIVPDTLSMAKQIMAPDTLPLENQLMAPDALLLKSDIFYLIVEMMMCSLNTDDVKKGLGISLSMLRYHLNSGNIAIYSKNADGIYMFKSSDEKNDEFFKSVGCIVNKTKNIFEKEKRLFSEFNLSERLQNMLVTHIDILDDYNKKIGECCLVVLNVENGMERDTRFWHRIKDTLQVILKRAVSYERNKKAITTDLLTGLDNRNSYEMRKQAFAEADENLVLGIFDIFRLKYINDNYTHTKGDEYIRETAKILSKYWPKEKVRVNDDGTEDVSITGHCVYRTGGDEFVLLTTKENDMLASVKAELAQQEACMIDLGLEEPVPLGVNYGIVAHNPGDSLKQTVMRADEIMQQDKDRMYKQYRLDRRH